MFSFNMEKSWDVVSHALSLEQYGNNTDGKAVPVLRKMWEAHKSPLVALLGETGRLEVPLSAELITPTHADLDYGYNTVHKWLRKQNAISGHRLVNTFNSATYNLSLYEISNNILQHEQEVAEGVWVKAGIKASTYVKQWLEAPSHHVDSDDMPLLNSAFSMLVGALKPKSATLVISVNPLDLLLLSEHTTGWGSCYVDDGQFRTAPLSLMMDSCTAVAYTYRRTEERWNVQLPVKLWRQLVFVDMTAQAALLGRQYPQEMDAVTKETRRVVAHLLAGTPSDQHTPYKVIRWTGSEDSHDENKGEPDNMPYCFNRAAWVYGDAVQSRVRLATNGIPSVDIGYAKIPCLVCGDWRRYSGDEPTDNFHCSACREDDTLCCSDCGDRCDEPTYFNGTAYCGRCYNDTYSCCVNCDDTFLSEDARRDRHGNPYCPDCAEGFVECVHCDDMVRAQHSDVIAFHDNSDDYVCSRCIRAGHYRVCPSCNLAVENDSPCSNCVVDEEEAC